MTIKEFLEATKNLPESSEICVLDSYDIPIKAEIYRIENNKVIMY